MEDNCRCTSGKKGRPAKKRVLRELSREVRESDTESGEEYETETERNSCLEFKSLIQCSFIQLTMLLYFRMEYLICLINVNAIASKVELLHCISLSRLLSILFSCI